MESTNCFDIITPLGYQVSITKFTSMEDKDVVIILSATGVLQSYYHKFSQFLQSNNYTVFTFDYGGIGKSKKKPLTKFDTTVSNWATNDIETVFKYVKEQYPTSSINCVAHSLGGQILGLVPSNKIINNIVLVASQTNHFSYWKGARKARVFINWFFLFPFFTTFFKYLPSSFFTKMENLPRSAAKEFSDWSKQKDYYFKLKTDNLLFHHQISSNLIGYSCTYDKFAPKEAVDWMVGKYTNAKKTRKHLNPNNYNVKKIGHFGFFRSQFKDSIWREFLTDLQL